MYDEAPLRPLVFYLDSLLPRLARLLAQLQSVTHFHIDSTRWELRGGEMRCRGFNEAEAKEGD